MNFVRFIHIFIWRCIGIIGSPKLEWVKIKEEDNSVFLLVTKFLLPQILLTVIATMIGSCFQMPETGFEKNILMISGLRTFLSISLSVIISILAINAMIKTFGGTPDVNRAAKLVVYSFTPVIIVDIIIGLIPIFYLSGLFLLYSFFIFFHGTTVLLDISEHRQSNFSTLSSTTMLIIYLIVSFILSSFFGSIQ